MNQGMSMGRVNGEMTEFSLNLDVDHRERTHNRTTQSCLNCHTSKRKVRHTLDRTVLGSSSNPSIQCDRGRPCSRCIQLGLVCLDSIHSPLLMLICHHHQTGLCVYEVGDPAIRNDPNADEVTKPRQRPMSVVSTNSSSDPTPPVDLSPNRGCVSFHPNR